MELTIENQLALMDKYSLTPEELMVINLLFMYTETNDSELLGKYKASRFTKHELFDVLRSLQEKKVLTKSCSFEKGKNLKRDQIIWNQLFLNSYRKCSGELGEEFFHAYPNECIIGGSIVMLRNYAKKYKDITDFFYAYGKAIGWKEEKHKEVLDIIQWAKEHNGVGLNMNIADFVISRMWENLKELKNGDRSGLTFDTTTSI